MLYWIIVVIASSLIISFIRYTSLKITISFPGYLVRNLTSITTYVFRNHTLALEKKYKEFNKITNWKVIEGDFSWYSVRNLDIDGLKACILKPKKAINKKIILQLHGGGYEISLPYNSLYFAKKYAEISKDTEVLTINYRVAPEDKFPAALDDCVKAYNYLLDEGYKAENIIIAGDSAGGGLTLATVMYLRDNEIALPKAIITMSAWTDLTNSLDSFKKNYKRDPVFGNSNQSIIMTSTYAEGMDKTNPYISPVFGSFKNFPNMLMQVGTHEMLLDDTLEVAKKAKKEGVNVKLSIYIGMFHIFQKYNWFLPESDRAWREVKKFICENQSKTSH